MTLRRVHLRITGLVQGVSYRASARDAAHRLGVSGWVRNLPNGDVEALAEAAPERIERFIAWCRRGPEEARVEAVTVTEEASGTPLPSFEVRR
ncbi:MAG: acylphosphatase [Myxococcota bacterium]